MPGSDRQDLSEFVKGGPIVFDFAKGGGYLEYDRETDLVGKVHQLKAFKFRYAPARP